MLTRTFNMSRVEMRLAGHAGNTCWEVCTTVLRTREDDMCTPYIPSCCFYQRLPPLAPLDYSTGHGHINACQREDVMEKPKKKHGEKNDVRRGRCLGAEPESRWV